MTYAKEVVGSFYGVQLPSWLRAFDCRSQDIFAEPKSPWGTILWSSEKAAVDLGLRGKGFHYDSTPLSCSTYIDARTCSEDELTRQAQDMVKEAIKLYAEWEEAKNFPPNGQGGSCLYCPVAICLSNFGWSVMCDERTCRVRAFGYNAVA